MEKNSSVWGEITARSAGLDADRLAALQRFIADVRTLFQHTAMAPQAAERAIGTLCAAYCAALTGGTWGLLVAALADALDAADNLGVSIAAELPRRRLRSLVRENADLLPFEMIELAVSL